MEGFYKTEKFDCFDDLRAHLNNNQVAPEQVIHISREHGVWFLLYYAPDKGGNNAVH